MNESVQDPFYQKRIGREVVVHSRGQDILHRGILLGVDFYTVVLSIQGKERLFYKSAIAYVD